MPDPRLNPEQRDRARRERNQALMRPTQGDLAKELQRGPVPRPARFRRKAPDCGECRRSSMSRCTWDEHRGLWVHTWCGWTITQEELDGVLDE